MQFWDILWGDIKRLLQRRRLFALDIKTDQSLRLMAKKRNTSPHRILEQWVEAAIEQDDEKTFAMQCWDELSQRERQVTALICKHMTTKQIAAKMGISPETVKTYVDRTMKKFKIHSREELRMIFANYDLTPFE